MGNTDRQQVRIEKEKIIRRMFNEGASIKEMMQATGYQKGTVGVVIAKIKAEMTEDEHLTFAKHPKPEMPIIEAEGKKYRDITDLFLSSEWREREAE